MLDLLKKYNDLLAIAERMEAILCLLGTEEYGNELKQQFFDFRHRIKRFYIKPHETSWEWNLKKICDVIYECCSLYDYDMLTKDQVRCLIYAVTKLQPFDKLDKNRRRDIVRKLKREFIEPLQKETDD